MHELLLNKEKYLLNRVSVNLHICYHHAPLCEIIVVVVCPQCKI